VNAKIERANLDGSNRTILVTYDLLWPTGLAVDYPNERIYFADTKKGTIETINLDGSDRQIVKTFGRSKLTFVLQNLSLKRHKIKQILPPPGSLVLCSDIDVAVAVYTPYVG
jgi:hypothetical protein